MRFSPLLLALLALGLAACTPTAEPRADAAVDPEAELAAIRTVLDDQVAAWNRGDLEAFMDGYWQSDSLRFASGGNVRQGWQAALEGYRRGYPDRAAMGTLAFEELDVRFLSPDRALAFGRWRLTGLPDEATATGLFTLILADRPEGWRVIHDHTSSAD